MIEDTNPTRRGSSVDHVSDVMQGVSRYARQETIEPLRGAARWVAVGTVGSLALGLSVVFLSLAVLRLVQDVGGRSVERSWSFIPYLATVAVLCILVAAIFSRISRNSLRKGD